MSIFERVDDSSMAATQYDNQTPISIDHQGRVLRNCIFDYRSVRHLHLRTCANSVHALPTMTRPIAFQEDPLLYVRNRKRRRIILAHRPSQRDESTGMISVIMIMGEDHVANVG